jgi:hypothetical protein
MLEWGGEAPSLDEAAQRLGLTGADLDADFGVALIDPEKHLYAVRGISEHAAGRGEAFSDPPISHFGPT